jgi:hypothetical protein
MGTDVTALKEKDGSPMGQKIYDAAKEGTIATAGYNFPKPGGTDPVAKEAYVTRVGGEGCGVGYYKLLFNRTSLPINSPVGQPAGLRLWYRSGQSQAAGSETAETTIDQRAVKRPAGRLRKSWNEQLWHAPAAGAADASTPIPEPSADDGLLRASGFRPGVAPR